MDTKEIISEVCPVCGDEGCEGGCLRCGKEPNLGASIILKRVTDKDMDRLNIPAFYKNNCWDMVKLLESKEHISENPDFRAYAEKLEKCLMGLKDGRMLNNSVIVTSPVTYSKTTWAMNCIMEAFKHGYKAVPLVDTNQLQRMGTLSAERPSEDWKNKCIGFLL